MRRILGSLVLVLALPAAPAAAQAPGLDLDRAAYVTCRDAQAMPREERIAFAVALVQRVAAHYGVPYAQGNRLDDQTGPLLRAGCTTFPDAYLFALTAMAVRRAGGVEAQPLPTVSPIPLEAAMFLTCDQYGRLSPAQKDALEFDLAVNAGRRYGLKFDDTPAGRAKVDEGITPLVEGTCILTPNLNVYAVAARAVQAAAERKGS